MALEKLVQTKISAAMPVRAAEKQAPSHFVMSVTYVFLLITVLALFYSRVRKILILFECWVYSNLIQLESSVRASPGL